MCHSLRQPSAAELRQILKYPYKLHMRESEAWNLDPRHETKTKHFSSGAERLTAVSQSPFGDFPAERAS
jgi:hypothetical protein